MSATATAVKPAASVAYLATVLSYHEAIHAQQAMQHSSDELLSSAYLRIEGAISALRQEGTQLDVIAALEAHVHKLAPSYERNRRLRIEASERCRATRSALGGVESNAAQHRLARELFTLADEIGDDTEADEALAAKVRDVAGMIDCEDY